MKIVVIVRTRNEETNIGRFCEAYDWVDEILIADGGSLDNTLKMAAEFPNVRIRPFLERTEMDNGLWRNPAGEHINFLLDWADELLADWIIFDDCDCTPNKYLKEDLEGFMELDEWDAIKATRLYLWGEDKHIEKMAKPAGDWYPSLLAWKTTTNIRFKTNPVNHTHELIRRPEKPLGLMPPYCLLHRAWPTEKAMKLKMEFYKASGQHPTATDPRDFYGAPVDLPEWAV